jgi:hypothetical protein
VVAALLVHGGGHGGFSDGETALLPERACRSPLFPQRKGRSPGVGAGRSQVTALPQRDEYRIHAARIVLDPAAPDWIVKVVPIQQRRSGPSKERTSNRRTASRPTTLFSNGRKSGTKAAGSSGNLG